MFFCAELPRLELLLSQIANKYGLENQKVVEAYETFKKVRGKIEVHLSDEEQYLFPACLKLADGEASAEVSAGPNLLERLVEMENEHENSGKAFEAILNVVSSINNVVADDDCQQFISGLSLVIADLKVHVEKENGQVHPQARQLLSVV